MNETTLRTEMLLGEAAMAKLARSHVAVFGLGGVGSWCAEALARSGVGALTLIDCDTVGLTNLNRQAEALLSTVGQRKTDAMAARVRDIAPNCRLTLIDGKYQADDRDRFFAAPYDYILDAIHPPPLLDGHREQARPLPLPRFGPLEDRGLPPRADHAEGAARPRHRPPQGRLVP